MPVRALWFIVGSVPSAGSDAVDETMNDSPRTSGSPSGFKGRLDPCRQRGPDPWHRGDLFDRGVADPLDRAEHLEQLALPLWSYARQVVERGSDGTTVAEGAVVGDREPVGLVAQALNQVEGG